jgi:hypothetical protein
MECWPNATQAERKQFEAIRVLTSRNPQLMEFLFDKNQPRLKGPPDQLMGDALGMCGSDFIVVKLCLDLWCEHGKVCVHEILSLDADLFELTLRALVALGRAA